MSRTRILLSVLIGFAVLPGSAWPQTTREQLNALLEGLNDPDPIVRLVTYEEAVASKSATIQRLALRTALQSEDADLRTLALRGALQNRGLVTFDLSRIETHEAALKAATTEEAQRKVYLAYQYHADMLNKYSGVLPIRITEYDYESGSLAGYCMVGRATQEDRYKVSGTIAGDELTLSTSCAAGSYAACTLKAELADSGKLVGSFHCNWGAEAVAELDLL